jgi:hypothetical protein
MGQGTTPSFRVECPECDVTYESDEFDETSEFVTKHSSHTGHEMKWSHADFDLDIKLETNWELTCDTCNEAWRFETVAAAREFQDEHAEYTNHEITNQPVEVEIDILSGKDERSLKGFIEKLENGYDEGVPEQAILAQFSEESGIGKVQHELNKLKQKGEVYEPQAGRLRTT